MSHQFCGKPQKYSCLIKLTVVIYVCIVVKVELKFEIICSWKWIMTFVIISLKCYAFVLVVCLIIFQ